MILRNGGKLTIESDAASPQELVEHAMVDPDGWLVTSTVAVRCADVAAFEVPPQDRRNVRARNARRPPGRTPRGISDKISDKISDTY